MNRKITKFWFAEEVQDVRWAVHNAVCVKSSGLHSENGVIPEPIILAEVYVELHTLESYAPIELRNHREFRSAREHATPYGFALGIGQR